MTPFRPATVVFVFLFLSVVPDATAFSSSKFVTSFLESPNALATEMVGERHAFYGLASYYNTLNYYLIDGVTQQQLSNVESVTLKPNQWFVIAGRFKVILVRAEGLILHIGDKGLSIQNGEILLQAGSLVEVTAKPNLAAVSPDLDKLRYAHLWAPLAELAKLVELSLVLIQSLIVNSWGWALVIFSLLLRLLLLPVGVMTVSFQRRVSQVQAQLAPKLTGIKAHYDGEEAHNRLMAAHKNLGVTPFYTLKPMLASLIQIPILIAVFNALGEMPQFVDQSFLWIDNLAYPDVIGYFPMDIRLFGSTISALPILMTAVTIYSTIIFQNRHASKQEMGRQKRNLYLMAAVFFVLFYPFPAVMVLYWTLSNILHAVQQQIVRI